MTSYQDLVNQRKELDQKIEAARKSELSDAISKARALVVQFNLEVTDVFPSGRKARAKTTSGNKVAPKYRDPATGQTWTGRGKAPKWIDGKDRAPFLIA
jgi:DNA-binding protein H-NS